MDIHDTNNDSMTKNCRLIEVITREEDRTTTNVTIDAKMDVSPIVGYAQMPLLPLAKACTPLIEIIHNIMFYVQMALDETPEEPQDGLTIDESAAIRLYTIEWQKPHRSLYSMLNETLKTADRKALQPYFKYFKLFLTALVKLPSVPPQTIWRGVTRDLSADFVSGQRMTWWAFSSCTRTMTVLENNIYLGNTGPRTLFSVETINGRKIRAHSHYNHEDEILLLPGTHMIVQSRLNPAPDLYVFHLKQIVPKTTLMALPFQGMLNKHDRLFEIEFFVHRSTTLSEKVSCISTLSKFISNGILHHISKTSLVPKKEIHYTIQPIHDYADRSDRCRIYLSIQITRYISLYFFEFIDKKQCFVR